MLENADKVYLKINQTDWGSVVTPANLEELDRVVSLRDRLEPKLVELPGEAALTSIAVSLVRLADETEAIRHIALMQYMAYKKINRSIWKKARDKYHEAITTRRATSIIDALRGPAT